MRTPFRAGESHSHISLIDLFSITPVSKDEIKTNNNADCLKLSAYAWACDSGHMESCDSMSSADVESTRTVLKVYVTINPINS